MFRRIMVTVLVVVALFAIAGGVGYWFYDGYTYYRTDDAQVTGKIINISAPAAGTLTSLNIAVGETVNAGQTIGTITLPTTSTVATSSHAAAPTTVNLTSPMDGTIVQVPAVQGQAVAPGLQLVSVTDLNTLNVVAYIDENSLNNISVNQTV